MCIFAPRPPFSLVSAKSVGTNATDCRTNSIVRLLGEENTGNKRMKKNKQIEKSESK